MKRILFVVLLFALAVFAVACDAFSSATSNDQPAPQPQPADTSGAGQATLPVPAGACQSRLWGKIVNTSGQARPNTQVDIVSASFKAKTVADANGLYGFAGLCAGEYAMTVTPQGGQVQPVPNKVTLDGSKQLKVDLQVK